MTLKNKPGLFILFFSFSFSFCAKTWAAKCVRVVENTMAELIQQKSELATPLDINAEKVKVPILKDQIYASSGLDTTGVFNQIVIARNEYLIPLNAAKPIKSDGCFLQPICLWLRNDSVAMKSFIDPSRQITTIRRGEKYLAVKMANNAQGDRFYLINTAKTFYWINSNDVAVYADKTCDEIKDAEPPPPLPIGVKTNITNPDLTTYQQKNDKYAFGFELGFGANYNSDAYSPFITEVPDASNVGSLSNPILTEIKKGQGFFVGPILEIRFSENFKLKLGTQYQENTIKYVGKENPTIASNSLESLPDTGGTLKNQSLVFSVAPAFEFGSEKHRLGLGVNLRTQYYISKPSVITYRVGTVFKANEVQIEAGPRGFENLTFLNLYYHWFPSGNSPFSLRLTFESDAKAVQAGLAAFY